jgi:hypothetical protein
MIHKRKHQPLYKKFITLRVNIRNNNHIYKLKKNKWKAFIYFFKRNNQLIKYFDKKIKKLVDKYKYKDYGNEFISFINKKTNKLIHVSKYKRTKIYTNNIYNVSKFASSGNSFKKDLNTTLFQKNI